MSSTSLIESDPSPAEERPGSMDIKLPDFPQAAVRDRGRNLRAGYQRGWGLQFGDLKGQVDRDELYHQAFKLAKGRTVVSEMNRMNLYLILRFGFAGLAPGHIVEFGAYRGGNALFMAKVCQVMHPARTSMPLTPSPACRPQTRA